MIQVKIDPYVKICMKAWLLCEASVYTEVASPAPRTSLIRECSDCAIACFEIVVRLVSNPDEGLLGNLALIGLLHCRQCASECAKYNTDEDLKYCGEICSLCGDALMDITEFSLN
jgi:hypothetical protein